MASSKPSLMPSFKVWLESDGKHVLGEGGVEILRAVDECKSLTAAAKSAKVSYKYAWDQIAEMERAIGIPVIRTRRGGRSGGGGAELTEAGRILLKQYRRVQTYVARVLNDPESWEAVGLRLSARNRLKGIVKNVEKGAVTTSVKIEVKVPATITAVITKEAVEELDIKPGDIVEAIVKATEVMIAKE